MAGHSCAMWETSLVGIKWDTRVDLKREEKTGPISGITGDKVAVQQEILEKQLEEADLSDN